MPDDELFSISPVALARSVAELISRPGVRTNCVMCGEEIINEREVEIDGQALCVSCAHGGYYATRLMALPEEVVYAQAWEER